MGNKPDMTQVPQEAAEKKTPFYKKGWFLLILGIVIGLIIGRASSCGGSNSDTKVKEEATKGAVTVSKEVETTTAADNGKVTFEKFMQIKGGMDYEAVKNIMGFDGELESQSDYDDGDRTTDMKWSGKGFKHIDVTFTNGTVSSKSQSSLAEKPENVKLDQYNQLQSGMTYDQAKSIMGGDGVLTLEMYMLGSTYQTYYWYGNDLLSMAIVEFEDGTITSRSQTGLK